MHPLILVNLGKRPCHNLNQLITYLLSFILHCLALALACPGLQLALALVCTRTWPHRCVDLSNEEEVFTPLSSYQSGASVHERREDMLIGNVRLVTSKMSCVRSGW